MIDKYAIVHDVFQLASQLAAESVLLTELQFGDRLDYAQTQDSYTFVGCTYYIRLYLHKKVAVVLPLLEINHYLHRVLFLHTSRLPSYSFRL